MNKYKCRKDCLFCETYKNNIVNIHFVKDENTVIKELNKMKMTDETIHGKINTLILNTIIDLTIKKSSFLSISNDIKATVRPLQIDWSNEKNEEEKLGFFKALSRAFGLHIRYKELQEITKLNTNQIRKALKYFSDKEIICAWNWTFHGWVEGKTIFFKKFQNFTKILFYRWNEEKADIDCDLIEVFKREGEI